jgi:hypothetical protein
MEQMGVPSFETKSPEAVDPENLLLARNFLQLYHAEHGTHIKHVSETEDGGEGNAALARETDRLGEGFSDWLDTVSGSKALEKYVRAHSPEDIMDFKGMDALSTEYDEYCKETRH